MWAKIITDIIMKILVVLILAVSISTFYKIHKLDNRIKSINAKVNNLNMKIVELEKKESANKIETPVTTNYSDTSKYIKIKSYKYK